MAGGFRSRTVRLKAAVSVNEQLCGGAGPLGGGSGWCQLGEFTYTMVRHPTENGWSVFVL